MNQHEFSFIEKRTGIRLPDSYKEVLLNYPKELKSTDAADYGLLNDPEIIIEENLEVRSNGYFGEDWPEHYFIIGINGCGDYYVIAHSRNKFEVGFVCHERMVCFPYASNLSEFITKYPNEY